MRLHVIRLGATLGCLVLGAVQADALVAVLNGDGGDMILTVAANGEGGPRNATFICNGQKAEYGVVLTTGRRAGAGPGEGAALPEDGADVTIKADGATLGRQHFDTFSKTLMLTVNGPTGRQLFDKVTSAGSVELDVGEKPFTFPLGDGKAEIGRYRTACGL